MAGLGSAPAQIGTPNPYSDLSQVFPALPQANATAGSDILSQLGGQLSPGTTQQLQDAAATFATKNGMPGSNTEAGTLGSNFSLESLGLNAENQVNQGLKNYSSVVPTISSTQTVNPALQTDINTQNAIDAAAPDPTAQANYAQSLYTQYLNSMRSPAGGSGSMPAPFDAGLIGATTGQPASAFQSYPTSPALNSQANTTMFGGQPMTDEQINQLVQSATLPQGGSGGYGGGGLPQGSNEGTGE